MSVNMRKYNGDKTDEMEGSFIKIVFGLTPSRLNVKSLPLATYPSSLLKDYSIMSGGQSPKAMLFFFLTNLDKLVSVGKA